MKSIKVCEYSRSRSFHYDLILQDQASGERSQDQWSSGVFVCYILCYVCEILNDPALIKQLSYMRKQGFIIQASAFCRALSYFMPLAGRRWANMPRCR